MKGRFSLEMARVQDERMKQVAIGAGLFMLLAVVVAGLLVSWRFIPGLLGEWVGTMMGLVMTPFILETSFAILGLLTVISLNIWRRRKDGDDFVYLEQVSGPRVPTNLPEHAKWAIYRSKPLEGEEPSPLEQAEGALAIGDFQAAMEWIGAMNQETLKRPETLRLRLHLALATGRTDLVKILEDEIRQSEAQTI
jgi:hypothetical protein